MLQSSCNTPPSGCKHHACERDHDYVMTHNIDQTLPNVPDTYSTGIVHDTSRPTHLKRSAPQLDFALLPHLSEKLSGRESDLQQKFRICLNISPRQRTIQSTTHPTLQSRLRRAITRRTGSSVCGSGKPRVFQERGQGAVYAVYSGTMVRQADCRYTRD